MRARLVNLVPLAWVLLLVAACTAMVPNHEPAQTPGEQLAQAQATLTGVYKSIADLTTAGALADADRARFLDTADGVDADLATAKRYLLDGFPDDALGRLTLINRALLDLQAHLREASP